MRLPGNITIKEFENKIAEYCGSEFSLAVCNATIGILGVFLALGLDQKEIITTPLTWPGALSGLLALNCRLKFCDVESETLTIDPAKLESVITKNTTAIFTADFLGYPAQLDEIKKICSKHNLLLIHDASSSFGSKYKGKYSGYFADVSVLSFGAKKLYTLGEGGCIITNKEAIYNKLVFSLTHPERQDIEINGYNPFALNTRINPLAAEYGLKSFHQQLEKIDKRRREIKKWFEINCLKTLNTFVQPNFYRVLINDEIRVKLSNKLDITLQKIPFNKVIYKEPTFIGLFGNHHSSCPIAEKAVRKYLTIEFNNSILY